MPAFSVCLARHEKPGVKVTVIISIILGKQISSAGIQHAMNYAYAEELLWAKIERKCAIKKANNYRFATERKSH